MDTLKGTVLAILGAIGEALDDVQFFLRSLADAMRHSMDYQGINEGLQTIVISVLTVLAVGLIIFATRGRLRLFAVVLITVIALHVALPVLLS